MWIDINAYMGQWPYKELIYHDCHTLVQRMDRFGIDISLVSNLNGVHYKNTQSANDQLFKEWTNNENSKNRLIPFAVINPTYAGWKYDFMKCVEDYHMQGVCVYPKYHDYPVDDGRLVELARLAHDHGNIMALTLRMVDSRQRSWMDLDKEWALKDVMPLIRKVPDAKYIIRNVANSTKLNQTDMELVKKGNILLDTSGRATNNLSILVEEFGPDTFAFGSHAPILDYCTGRLRIEYLDESESVKNQLRNENAAKMLNLT